MYHFHAAMLSVLFVIGLWPKLAECQSQRAADVIARELSWKIVNADDNTQCRIEGRHSIWMYPRSVGRQSVALFAGSRLSVNCDASAIYLRLPPVFASPGPRYSDFADARLRVRVDEQPWQEIEMATARQEWPIAEDLAPGEHSIVVEPVGHQAPIDGFRIAPDPLSAVLGTITTTGYLELLTDVRIDVAESGELIRSEYLRNPLTGNFEVWGLAPGTYALSITAAGWLPHKIPDVMIERPGQRIDLGVITLTRDPSCGGRNLQGSVGPRFGHSISTQPGQSFRTIINLMAGTVRSAQLVSAYKTVDISITDIQPLVSGTATDVGLATFLVPTSAPHDAYDLRLSFATDTVDNTIVYPRAICVREPLPDDFHIAGIGHMNTWGQQTSEYLARVANVAEIAGARSLLVSNEVNAAYVCGALKDLRIPYFVTQGNHTMPRWNEFFGASSLAYDDGAMRIVTFGNWPYESWFEAARLLTERPDATNRVLLCFEGYAPLDVIRETRVDLLFDGHSDREHPDLQMFPSGTLHMRAPTQESIRWIHMTRDGFAREVHNVDDVPVLDVPRRGQLPLRVSFSAPNDGNSSAQTAIITNEYSWRFPHGRLRLVMRGGRYRLQGGKTLQSFDSDDGTRTIIDTEVDLQEKAEVVITVKGE